MVDALEVWKLEVVPNSEAIVALVAVKEEIIAEVKLARVAKKLVDVELVIVPLATLIADGEKFTTFKLVIVALVNVELVEIKLVVLVFVAFEVEAFTV